MARPDFAALREVAGAGEAPVRGPGPLAGTSHRDPRSAVPLAPAYVRCFFFSAAGNRTLLRINRYPGECLKRDSSVGGSPTMC